MKATDHLQMPELISSRVDVRMTDAEKSLYDKFKQDMVLKLPEGELDAVNAAALSGKLLQMANGAVYGDERKVLTIHDRKLDALEDIIEAANGKPLLVAYWFNHDRDRIMADFLVPGSSTHPPISTHGVPERYLWLSSIPLLPGTD
jgi:hypothetical protein